MLHFASENKKKSAKKHKSKNVLKILEKKQRRTCANSRLLNFFLLT